MQIGPFGSKPSICDAIRQNESEVTQISFLYKCIKHFLMPHLAENPMKIDWLVQEIQAVKGSQLDAFSP